MRQAASGLEALTLLREYRPDAILMDLAMPGIDGWETIRRLRREGLSDAPVAIVSANAFDQGLDNDVGLGAADFVLKPVRIGELLDWLGGALALDWVQAPMPAPPTPVAAPPAAPMLTMDLPPEPRLRALEDAINLGYFRGIVKLLDAIEAESAECGRFVAHMRVLARQFQLDAMADLHSKGKGCTNRRVTYRTPARSPPPHPRPRSTAAPPTSC